MPRCTQDDEVFCGPLAMTEGLPHTPVCTEYNSEQRALPGRWGKKGHTGQTSKGMTKPEEGHF